ncbi:scopoletin glucosyltransferase-like protein [Cinnamomum micranthum f. kanehirae]|uniref:Glycosyltransferase n=1 Tax=Cinnamomum micranthum f. kanehirae TaxID=337451 RepID=A0A443P767_9MAGN|nr:scopoletin glucosyltransferase-like protein [Cinnamomum micranthum f. kanehirae]
MSGRIVVFPFHGQGHLFPCTELCFRLAARNHNITLLLPSPAFSSSALHNHPHIQISFLQEEEDEGENKQQGPPPPPFPPNPALTTEPLLRFLHRHQDPICAAIVDVMMSWSIETFSEFKIPTFSFFTSGACSAAMEFGLWKLHPLNPTLSGQPQIIKIPSLPESVSLTLADLHHQPPPPPLHSRHQHRPPPPHAATRPVWLHPREGFHPVRLLRLLRDRGGRRRGWQKLRAREIRSGPKRESNVSEEEVSQWLDQQQRGSVIYVAFGTEVGPSKGELEGLAVALEKSNRPFIWTIQDTEEDSEFFPTSEEEERKGKGLFIRGWAPQLMILSHPSTGGFVTHCGWNSITEALGRGVPLLAWPIRGDQHYNAKLVSGHLKVGLMVRSTGDGATTVTSDDIIRGIEKLMADDETRSRAASIRSIFECGFPSSSEASLDAFTDHVHGISQQNS